MFSLGKRQVRRLFFKAAWPWYVALKKATWLGVPLRETPGAGVSLRETPGVGVSLRETPGAGVSRKGEKCGMEGSAKCDFG